MVHGSLGGEALALVGVHALAGEHLAAAAPESIFYGTHEAITQFHCSSPHSLPGNPKWIEGKPGKKGQS